MASVTAVLLLVGIPVEKSILKIGYVQTIIKHQAVKLNTELENS